MSNIPNGEETEISLPVFQSNAAKDIGHICTCQAMTDVWGVAEYDTVDQALTPITTKQTTRD